jgi:hypothetical protein
MTKASFRRAGISSVAAALAGLAIVALPTMAASAAPHRFNRTICSSGIVFPGIYTSLLVVGSCRLTESGVVTVLGQFRVGQNATFDGITDGTLRVRGNVEVDEGGTMNLGCNTSSVGPPCLTNTTDVVDGSVTATDPLEMVWHSDTVRGNYEVSGSIDNTSCAMTDAMDSPDYFTYEDGAVRGGITFEGLDTCWLGMFRTRVGRNAVIDDNRTNTTVPGIAFDSPEIATNFIRGGLFCAGNVPRPTFGDSHGLPNRALRGKHGQCRHL